MLTRSQIAKASADAQIAFCLDKQPTYEVAIAREIEALMLSRIAELQETNALNNKVIDAQHRAMVNAEQRGAAKGIEESAERIAALEAKLAQREKDDELTAIVPGSLGHLKLMMGASSWQGRVELSDVLANIDEFSAAPAAPEQQDQSEQHLGMVAQAPLQRAIDLNEKASMPWDDAFKLALEEIGIGDTEIDDLIGNASPSALVTMLDKEEVREFVRSVLIHQHAPAAQAPNAQQAEAQEPCATINISDDDFDLGLTDDYAFGIKRLPNGKHQLFTRPQPAQLQALTDEQRYDLIVEHLGPSALTGGKMTPWDIFMLGISACESAHGIGAAK